MLPVKIRGENMQAAGTAIHKSRLSARRSGRRDLRDPLAEKNSNIQNTRLFPLVSSGKTASFHYLWINPAKGRGPGRAVHVFQCPLEVGQRGDQLEVGQRPDAFVLLLGSYATVLALTVGSISTAAGPPSV